MVKHFLTLFDLSSNEITQLISRAIELKKNKYIGNKLEGRTLGLVFEKESTRTRTSFEVAMNRLGGKTLYLGSNNSQISRGESYADTSRVLSRYLDGIVMRTFGHECLQEMADYSRVPVINGLTDFVHPCQLLADLMTVVEHKENLGDQKYLYLGDGNNMTHSWIHAAMILDLDLVISCPAGYGINSEVLEKAKAYSKINFIIDPVEAVQGATVINTDTWFSMGQEVSEEKREAFSHYQVNEELLSQAAESAIVLHCLPAHRGEEITNEVIDGKQSVVFDQAENRLYAQMALLEKLL